MANTLNTLLTTIQTELKANVTLTSSDSEVAAVDTTNGIVIRKMGLRERSWEIGHENEVKPGILIVYSGQKSPKNGGTNASQDVYYSFDLIVITQDNHLRSEGIATYTQWAQNIGRYFNHNSTVVWPNNSDGVVWDTWGLGSESLNDWRWVNQGEATFGTRVEIVSREPHAA